MLDGVCACVHVVGEIWMERAVLVSVMERVYFCVCVRSVMILAVLVHWGNGAC